MARQMSMKKKRMEKSWAAPTGIVTNASGYTMKTRPGPKNMTWLCTIELCECFYSGAVTISNNIFDVRSLVVRNVAQDAKDSKARQHRRRCVDDANDEWIPKTKVILHKTVQVVTIVILFQEKNQEENKFEIKLDTKNYGLLKRVHACKNGHFVKTCKTSQVWNNNKGFFTSKLHKSVAISFFLNLFLSNSLANISFTEWLND